MVATVANRVQLAINRTKAKIEECRRTGIAASGQPYDEAKFDKGSKFEFDEHFHLQELKSLAVLQGTLTQDEGQLVYNLAGETVEHINKQPIEVRVVLSQLLLSLLKLKTAR